MTKKELKLNIKNTQLAKALKLEKIKDQLDKKKVEEPKDKKSQPKKAEKSKKSESEVKDKDLLANVPEEEAEAPPRRKARSKSAFAEPTKTEEPEAPVEKIDDVAEEVVHVEDETIEVSQGEGTPPAEEAAPIKEPSVEEVVQEEVVAEPAPPKEPETVETVSEAPVLRPKKDRLGPTGRHVKDLVPPKPPKRESPKPVSKETKGPKSGGKFRDTNQINIPPKETDDTSKKGKKQGRFKEFRDISPAKKGRNVRGKPGFSESEDSNRWRKKRSGKGLRDTQKEDLTVRPTSISVRIPISIKDIALEMKLKASELIGKLFLQGVVVTINDILDDETTIKLLGEEFGCEINIDTSEEERIRITDKTIDEEISESNPEELKPRAPVVTFMGHVDHGKTSLIDYIRKSNTASGEAGAITQHIGAFLCKTEVGDIAVLDTPGHEAFSEMRARGANVTDIVVLVIAGDEGIRAQTQEAINHAKAAGVNIIVAINKCDKPNFDAQNVYRQLADQELLPESWGGQTITINCSAQTGEGIKELLEMLALQAEVLELKANPSARARGAVLESELHKGMGSVATVLVQNGTLNIGDALVFGEHWGKVKTMRDEFNSNLLTAPPSMPVEITGISGLPEAGEEFIVVSTEKEARDIANVRMTDKRHTYLLQKKSSLENIFQDADNKEKKTLNIVLRADVQGSMEALKVALQKIESDKADLEIISSGIGEISESDVLLAAASNAIILGFHTQVESHAEQLLKQHGVHIALHDVIYHAVDDIKGLMTGLLDKVAQENEMGKAEVRAVFKASQLGKIAGCLVVEGSIHRNHQVRIVRNGEIIWRGPIASLKKVQEDVREVQKGVECGIVLSGTNDIEEGDIIEAYEVRYISQKL